MAIVMATDAAPQKSRIVSITRSRKRWRERRATACGELSRDAVGVPAAWVIDMRLAPLLGDAKAAGRRGTARQPSVRSVLQSAVQQVHDRQADFGMAAKDTARALLGNPAAT